MNPLLCLRCLFTALFPALKFALLILVYKHVWTTWTFFKSKFESLTFSKNIHKARGGIQNEASVGKQKKMASKGSDRHCCVPLCAGNGRKNPKLAFHKIVPKPKAKQVWIQAIRRDPGPYFKVSLQLYRLGLLHPQAIWTQINDGYKVVVIKYVYLYILVVHIRVWSTE